MRSLWEVLSASARLQMLEMRSNVIAASVVVFNPVLFLTVPLLSSPDRSAAAGTRIGVPVALMIAWTATAWGAAGVLRLERTGGTLARTLSGLVDPRLVVLGRGLGASIFTTSCSLLSLGLTLLALRQPVRFPNAAVVLAGYAILVASGSAIGLLIGTVFILTRYGPQVSAILVTPVLLFGGLLVPSHYFVPPLSWVAAVFSLRWLREFVISATLTTPNYVALTWSVVITAAYALAGAYLFARVVLKARADGTLDLV